MPQCPRRSNSLALCMVQEVICMLREVVGYKYMVILLPGKGHDFIEIAMRERNAVVCLYLANLVVSTYSTM